MAFAIRYTTTPAQLVGWEAEGWTQISSKILRAIPGDAQGNPIPHVQFDAFEWEDISAFGIGNADSAVSQMQGYIRQAGSELWAWSMYKRTEFDALGVKAVRYRLLLSHSQVQLVGAAIVILAVAFSAIIFWQYVTTGQSPALKDLQNLWGSAVTSVGQAGGEIVSSATNTVWAWLIGLGGAAIAFSVIAKDLGVKPPRAPAGSVGVRAGGVTARLGS